MPAIQNPPTQPRSIDETETVRSKRFDPPHEIPRAEPASERDTLETARGPARPRLKPDAAEVSGVDLQTFDAKRAAALPRAAARSSSATANAAVVENLAPTLLRQFRTQSRQLADHLDTRQRELDHREAELHTQLARHDAAARSARLWFQEQHRKLSQRQAEWQRCEKELAAKLCNFSGPASLLASQIASDDESASSAETIDQEIAHRLRESEFHELSAQLEARQHHSDAVAKLLDARQDQIEAAEARVARAEAQLQQAREELHAEREDFVAHAEKQRRQWTDLQLHHETELVRQRAELADRSKQVEQRTAAVEQMRAELLELQRETLESQLALEELRAELAGKAPPAAIAQSLARLRVKLTEQYRLQIDDLDRQRRQLAEMVVSIGQQHRQLAERQQELDAWSSSQQRQLEEQAAHLAAREAEIEQHNIERESLRLGWQSERRQLEAEVRRLQAYIRRIEGDGMTTR